MDLLDITRFLKRVYDYNDNDDNGNGTASWNSTAAPNTNKTNTTLGYTNTTSDEGILYVREVVKPIGLFFIGWAILVPLFALLGLVGNGLTMVVLWRREMRSTTVLYLRALAITDTGVLIVSVISLTPISLASRYTGYTATYYRLCIYPYIYMPLLFAQISIRLCNIWITVAVSIERYISICHPFKARTFLTKEKALTVIGAISVISIVSSVPYLFVITIEIQKEMLVLEGSGKLCNNNTMRHTAFGAGFYPRYVILHYAVLQLVIPLAILVVANGLVVRKLVVMKRRRLSSSARRSDDEANFTLTLILVVIVFICCQLPSLVIHFFIKRDESNLFLDVVAETLVTLNSAVNFLIYTALGRKFRHSLLQVFRRITEGTINLSNTVKGWNSKSNEVSKDIDHESKTPRFNFDSTSKNTL